MSPWPAPPVLPGAKERATRAFHGLTTSEREPLAKEAPVLSYSTYALFRCTADDGARGAWPRLERR
jgi:hypothetical protein